MMTKEDFSSGQFPPVFGNLPVPSGSLRTTSEIFGRVRIVFVLLSVVLGLPTISCDGTLDMVSICHKEERSILVLVVIVVVLER